MTFDPSISSVVTEVEIPSTLLLNTTSGTALSPSSDSSIEGNTVTLKSLTDFASLSAAVAFSALFELSAFSAYPLLTVDGTTCVFVT